MRPRTSKQNEEIRQQTSKQIVDVAFELFANEGYSIMDSDRWEKNFKFWIGSSAGSQFF